MDKIPAALQHKIDYIKALDIPVEQKSRRIAIEILDYWNLDASMSSWYLNDIASLIAGANTGDSKAQIKRVNAHISTLDALLEMGVNNATMSSGTPMPKVKPAKTNINEGGCGPDKMWDPTVLRPIIKRPDILKCTPYESPPPPPMPPKRVICEDVKSPMSKANALLLQQLQVGFASIRNKPDQHEHNLSRFLLAGSFSLCAAIGFVIGVTFGSSL